MSNSPSRSRGAFLRPRFATLLHSPRIEGWAERRETFGCVRSTRGYAITRRTRRLARRLASHDAGRSPLGAPPWRFWAPGPRFSHRHPPPLPLRRTLSKPAIALRRRAFAPDRLQRAPRSQVVVPGGRLPGLPGRTVTSRRRGTPRLAPHSGSSLEHALNERGWAVPSTAPLRSQVINSLR